MSQLRQRIRLAVDSSQQGSLFDLIAQAIPNFARNTDVQIEVGFFSSGVLVDISRWSAVTVNITPKADTSSQPVIQKIVGTATLLPESGLAWNAALTLADWEAGTGCHVMLVLTSSDTNVYMDDVVDYFQMRLVASASTTTSWIPSGQHYSSGVFTVTLPPGLYTWTKSVSDTSLVYDSTTLNATGTFTLTAQTTVTLNGVGNNTITAMLAGTCSTTQQFGDGQIQIEDTGIGQMPPPSVTTPTYLTEAMGDARYTGSVDLTAINAAIADLQAYKASLGGAVALSTLAPLSSPTLMGALTVQPQQQGVNLIPLSTNYTGSGPYIYTLTVVQGATYYWTKIGANDISLVNGTQTLSASGAFTAQSTSVILTGNYNTAVTATVYVYSSTVTLAVATLLATPSAGAIEFDGSNLYITNSLLSRLQLVGADNSGTVNVSATTGTPAVLTTPVAWLKIKVGSGVYYLPLYQ